jgi:hypothetical protein
MEYKVTKQYAQDREIFLAEFTDKNDALFFIQRRILADDENNIKLIYRLFDEKKLLDEFNKEKISSVIRVGEYASGDKLFSKTLGPFHVCKIQSNLPPHAAFIRLNDAELFVEDKLTQEKDIITYYIFNADKLIAELNQRIKQRSYDPKSLFE